MTETAKLLERPQYPRSNKYDQDWVLDNQMGPNALWLTEWLCEKLQIDKGMRILDLGCGRAMTSIFLAKEFGAEVWAADLWMSPDGNWQRVREAGVGDRVFPIKAEAHALPFAQDFFDVVVSMDAYQYFGTDEMYLDYISRFIRPGGSIGIVTVGLMHPIGGSVPEHLTTPQAHGKPFWEEGCRCFKTVEFWRDLWARCSLVADVVAEAHPEGWKEWRDFEKALELTGKSVFPSEVEALERDQGRYIGLMRMVASRTENPTTNFYDPTLGVKAGVDK